jgi:Na+/proline symporter
MFVDDGKLSVVSIISLVSLGIGSMGMPFIYDGAVNAKSIKDIDKGRINGIIFDGIVVVSGGVLSLLMAPVVYPFKIQEDNCFYQMLERMVDALLAGRSIRFPVKIVVIGTFALLLIMLISGLFRMIQGLITGMFPEAEKLKLPQGGLLIDLGTVIICALLLCIFVYMNSMCTYKNVIWAWEFVEAVISAPFVLSLISLKTTKTGTLWGMIMGAAAYLFWIFAPVYNGKSLENVTELNGGPVAFAAAFITIYVVSRFTARPADEQIKILARVKMEQQ